MLSDTLTTHTDQHLIYPYIHWFSHQRKNANTFRAITFPDEIPRQSNTFHLEEGDFLKHTGDSKSTSSSGSGPGYDFVVTLFFIDTSTNIINTVEHIHTLLRPGGSWINLGPLLWTGGGQAAMELSLEEVLRLADVVGFDVEDPDTDADGPKKTARRTVECEYTADRTAMMRWLYQAEFWVARKRT